ncbi:MAG: sugar transferase [Armatimonadota bacterium]
MRPYAAWKRGFDFAGATILLVAMLPVWLLTVIILLIVQGRPIFYRQSRVGLHGQAFLLLKFRTMRDGDPPKLPDVPVVKHPRDPRVTPFGHLLRRLSIDELPQLLNILHGEMSLVGPRPLPVDDLEHPGWLEKVNAGERTRRLAWLECRHQVIPGLTGLWQVSANPAEDFENWMTRDLAYVERQSFGLDLLILCKTPWAIFRGRRHSSEQREQRTASMRE